MTTIAAIQGDGWAVVGYDSRVSDIESNNRFYTMSKPTGKVIKHGEYLIGAAGDLRALNLVTYSFDPPKIPRANTNLDKFITTTFIPALRTCFEENGAGKDGEHNSHIIVVVRGRVYEIGSQYEWCQDVRGVYSIGSGGAYAIGALYACLPKKFTMEQAKKSVREAIEVAASLDPATGLPITVVAQKLDKTDGV